jgi:hypothetical protein
MISRRRMRSFMRAHSTCHAYSVTGQKGYLLIQQTRQQAREFERIQHSARRCADCGHVFFVPPAADVLSRYYKDVYPASSISWSNVDADYETSRVKYRSELILKICNYSPPSFVGHLSGRE